MSQLPELIKILKQRSVKIGQFTLASGKTSDFYVDARQTTLYSRGAQLIAELILKRLHPEVTAIGGPVTGADPITGATVALSAATSRPINGFMVRKAAKGYGAQNWLEGQAGLEKGTAVCVVEDTVTTGGSLLKAIKRIEDAGYKVVQCIAVVDREEGARESIEDAGYPFEALTTKQMLMVDE
ncbi:MAG: orotate phosphoribosyltransferase [Myxococcota bacterium]